MNSDFKSSEDTSPEPAQPSFGAESSGSSSFPSNQDLSGQAQQVWDKVSGTLGNLPDYVTDFFKEYKRPIITVGIFFGAIVSVKLVLAILGAVNEIPLLAPTFELIGLSYTGWFLYRYLLKASNRQELLEDINSLKDQVLGKNS